MTLRFTSATLESVADTITNPEQSKSICQNTCPVTLEGGPRQRPVFVLRDGN